MNSEDYFSEIVDRLKIALDTKKDLAVANFLEISPTAFSNRRKTGSVPYEQIISSAYREGITLDYIFSGLRPIRMKDLSNVKLGDLASNDNALSDITMASGKPYDPEMMEFAIECAELYITEADKQLTPHKKAKLVRMLYEAIRDDEEHQPPEASKIIDLIELASQEEKEGRNNGQNKEEQSTGSHR